MAIAPTVWLLRKHQAVFDVKWEIENLHLLLCHCSNLTNLRQKCSLSSLHAHDIYANCTIKVVAMATEGLKIKKYSKLIS